MRILFVIRTLMKSGAERMLVNICNELVKREGFSVAIYTVNQGNEYGGILDKRVKVLGGDIVFHFSLYRKNWFENENYIQFVNEFQPDFIHSHLHYADLLAHTYHYPKATYISHQHNSEVPEYVDFKLTDFTKKSNLAKYYEFSWIKKQFKKFDTNFVACSEGTRLLIERKIGNVKMVTLPNAIPLPKLDYENKEIGKEFSLIWVGRFSDVKRPQMAILIAEILKQKNLKFQLKLAGIGPEMEDCKKIIQEKNLSNYVKLLGVVEDMESFYKSGDLMIHTSVYEGLPMVFIEANSYGVPIITTDCMPNNEIIEDGFNGRIIKTDNLEDFISAITQIIDNPEKYKALSKNAITQSKKFGIENYVDKMLDFYNKIKK